MSNQPGRILLTGSTGYIGGRLAPLLLERGHSLVCLVREPRKLEARGWAQDPRVTIVKGDVGDRETVAHALQGCQAAYYLVHAMESGKHDFMSRDRELATAFAQATRDAALPRIIYLGGLGEDGPTLSKHLRSRREVEQIFRDHGVPTTSFRAPMILGSGSASFEILRYLVERLPAMVTPRWVRTESQPISVVDVLGYLADSLDLPETEGRVIEIGGPRVVTYRELMQLMASELGLPRRLIITLPVLTPRLSSLWIGLVTPVGPAIARPLAEGLRNRVVVTDSAAAELMPRDTIDPAEAIRRALTRLKNTGAPTRWSAAGIVAGDPDWAGGTVFEDQRRVEINARPDAVFAAVCRVGGGHGWYAADILWKIRGLMDQAMGGPGLRRGRRLPETVEFGETLDFWRVTDLVPDRRLALTAEMKLPGIAKLEFDIEPTVPDDAHPDRNEPALSTTSALTMTARFRPKGLLGLAYWYAVLPFHNIVFRGMLRGMQRTAERIAKGEEPSSARHA